MFLPFAAECARACNVPSLVFHGTSFFSLCVSESIAFAIECARARDDDNRPFVVPGLPDSIVLRPSQVPRASAAPLMKRLRESNALSYGAVFNSFYELEPAYAEHYRTRLAHRAWHVGPVCLFRTDKCDELLLSWLDSKEPGSVVYACFGSMSRFSRVQLEEIASGLVASGQHFMWATRDSDVKEDMLAGHDKGMIARGWVAQMAILRHPAIGGFVTHCGWNSVIEGLCAGVPMVTWPLFAEQFFNERMVVDVLRVGVAVGATEWGDEREEVVAGEALRGAVERVMDGGGEAEGMRGRVREIGEAARRAVREGGSSHADLGRLMEELVEVNMKRG
ncbi:UDP-glucose flavonoid 3-O-glucosyltransferase 7 [Acorus calamus]|uniref:UDP-glucose flavonoid 3-O-glucosyltransferase 7 n=1 Tax=Acorus calamus TaxID=4465 RepID=A0AAV9DJV7_ACOCL|nr:UDP-glucose flavonoid 3-O-glucosyltransferase 7 [Acorus calamus]